MASLSGAARGCEKEFHERGSMMLRDAMAMAQSRAFGERTPQPQQEQVDDGPLLSIVAFKGQIVQAA